MKRLRLSLSEGAIEDLERLQDLLLDSDEPLAADFLAFVVDALDVLTHQPGVGRRFPDGIRELIIERGRSGYLAHYWIDRTCNLVHIARIRHQREAGYTEEET